MSDDFFAQPILNSPYEYPASHWELDESGQPTQKIVNSRRRAEFITPIPKPKKRRAAERQEEFDYDAGLGLSTEKQRYEAIPIINELRQQVDEWRMLENPRTRTPKKKIDDGYVLNSRCQ